MGISSMPSPSEALLTILVVNTVQTISILKEIVRSILRFFGVRWPDPAADRPATSHCGPCEPTVPDRFRNRFKPVRFGSSAAGRRRGRAADCRVCLARFEPDSVVDRLACGHLFHRACLDKWLDYHHVTCPLCRTYLLPGDDPSAATASWSWF